MQLHYWHVRDKSSVVTGASGHPGVIHFCMCVCRLFRSHNFQGFLCFALQTLCLAKQWNLSHVSKCMSFCGSLTLLLPISRIGASERIWNTNWPTLWRRQDRFLGIFNHLVPRICAYKVISSPNLLDQFGTSSSTEVFGECSPGLSSKLLLSLWSKWMVSEW